MLIGMCGIFIVTLVFICVILLLNKLTGKKNKADYAAEGNESNA